MADTVDSLQIEIEASSKSAASKLKKLTDALKKLQESTSDTSNLSKISNQLKELSDSAKKLNSGSLGKISSTLKSISENSQDLSVSTNKLGSSFQSLAKKVLNLAIYKRIANIAGGWVNESNDYVENLNLFTVSMGKYAESAKAYAETVQSAIGIDPSEWMRNQGVFMSIASGFGVVSDKAELMSKNLTQIGYDISSFYNIDINEAMQKVQSGISGELEPLRRLGYALDAATLQQIAYDNGIQQSINTMTQAQKSQLRYLAIMQQSGNVMNDMARTVLTPANSLRILNQQITQLQRALGNVLIPVLIQIIPYVQAFVEVLTEAAQALALFLGFTIPKIDYSGLDGVTSGAEDAADALGTAGKAAKDLKNAVLGIDELNIISPKTDSGGAGGVGGSFDLPVELPEYDFLKGLNREVQDFTATIKDFLNAFKNSAPVQLLWDVLKGLWENAIKPLGSWIISHPDIVANMLAAIGVAIVTYNVVSGIISVAKAISDAGGLLAGLKGIASATGATGVLSALAGILTNPWAITIAAVAGALTMVGLSIYDAYQKEKEADLARRFGNITLSLEELQEVAENLTTTEFTLKIDAYMEQKDVLEKAYESFNSVSQELAKETWKVGIGLEINPEDFKGKVDDFIEQAQQVLNEQKVTYKMLIDIGFSSENVKLEMNAFVDEYFGKSQGEMERLGKQLRQEMDEALADGIIDAEEAKTIANLQKEMNEIVQQMAAAEYKAKITNIKMNFKGTDLTPESFKDLQEQTSRAIQEQLERIEIAKIDSIKVAELRFAQDGNEQAYRAALDDIQQNFNNQKFELELQATSVGLDAIREAYKTELDAEMPKLASAVSQALGSSFDNVWDSDNDGNPVFNLTTFWNNFEGTMDDIFETQLTPAMRSNIHDLFEVMRPQAEEMEKLRQEMVAAGQEVPKSLSDALTEANLIMALAGDSAALNTIIGTAISSSPEHAELFRQLAESGYNIPQELMNGMASQSEALYIAGNEVESSVLSGTQDQFKTDQQAWEKEFNQVTEWADSEYQIQNGVSEEFNGRGKTISKSLFSGTNTQLSTDQGEWGKMFKTIPGLADTTFAINNGRSDVFNSTGKVISSSLKIGTRDQLVTDNKAWGDLFQKVPNLMMTTFGITAGVSSIFLGVGKTIFDSLKAGAQAAWDSFMSWWNSTVKVPEISFSGKVITKTDTKKVSGSSIKRYATGGYPDSGQLFIANEAGPELIGSIGNRTAVANSDQIISGIQIGVEQGNVSVVAALYQMIGLLEQIAQKETTVELDGEQIAQAASARPVRRGYNLGLTT